jgi:glycosyltransferase involved in cell wall biosynthesis
MTFSMRIERARERVILLVAPNLSRRMGGEAQKALAVCTQLIEDGHRVIQVAHERCQAEMDADFPHVDVRYVRDNAVQVWLYRRFGKNWIINAIDAWLLNRLARRVAREESVAIAHFVTPISPVLPHFGMGDLPFVIGPLNGNIFHPKGLEHRADLTRRLRKSLMPAFQAVLGSLFRGKRKAAAILVAGGTRTRRSLELAGITGPRLIDTLDSGIANEIAEHALVEQTGRKAEFVFLGRLVEYKGCDLAIRALSLAAPDATLDIIGKGEEEPALRALIDELGLTDRVRFLGWIPNGEPLFEQLRRYRAFLFPSLGEANGIVLQEAMMLGLPIVTVAWGGALELLDDRSAVMIAPTDEATVAADIAEAMDRLAAEPELANCLARNARRSADERGFIWSRLTRQWVEIYDAVLAKAGQAALTPAMVAQNDVAPIGLDAGQADGDLAVGWAGSAGGPPLALA